MRVKKLAAVTLCVALGLSTVLAGCGKTAQTAESGTAAAGQTDAGPDGCKGEQGRGREKR